MKSKFLSLCFIFGFTGCLTRAPSDYELDKRSGFVPPLSPQLKENEKSGFYSKTATKKDAISPNVKASLVEKIWVYNLKLDNRMLQGTWLWVEIEKGWLDIQEPEDLKEPGLIQSTPRKQ